MRLLRTGSRFLHSVTRDTALLVQRNWKATEKSTNRIPWSIFPKIVRPAFFCRARPNRVPTCESELTSKRRCADFGNRMDSWRRIPGMKTSRAARRQAKTVAADKANQRSCHSLIWVPGCAQGVQKLPTFAMSANSFRTTPGKTCWQVRNRAVQFSSL